MTSVRGRLLSAVALALATAAVPAGASARGAPPVKNTVGSIEALAMDGPLVAYATADSTSGCHKVVVWNVLTGAATRASGPAKGRCFSDEPHGQRVTAVAVAGTRLAWIRNITGNTEADEYLYTASLPRPKEQRLAAVRRVGKPPSQGGIISGLVGDDDLLAASLIAGDAAGGTTTLRAISGTSLKTVVTRPGAFAAVSADLGRVALLGEDSVSLYSASGVLLRTIPVGAVRDIALRKDYLVTLTAQGALDIYNANTGAFVRSWPVPARASALLDVHSGIAVYAVWRRLHALRLQTGKDVVIASPPRAIRGVEIEAPGVVYAYTTFRRGRVVGNLVFVPMRRVIDALS